MGSLSCSRNFTHVLRSFTYTPLGEDEENFTERIIIIIDLFGGTATAASFLLGLTNPGEFNHVGMVKGQRTCFEPSSDRAEDKKNWPNLGYSSMLMPGRSPWRVNSSRFFRTA